MSSLLKFEIIEGLAGCYTEICREVVQLSLLRLLPRAGQEEVSTSVHFEW